ncbi:uncharacterized protein LOC119190166 isoform X2 [Manduca sexta]|nr:uncharacterized protein LOC119190166 isoform X2 [Manduca sexta]
MNRPIYAQLEGLVEFLEQNPGIAKGLLRTAQAKIETKRKWATVATSLNALGGAVKDGQGWAKYWAEKKCALKKHCAQYAASVRRTGGGSADNLPTLSAIEKRLMAVMGGHEFAIGDRHLTVNPFPELATPEIATEQNEEIQIFENIQLSPIPTTSEGDAMQATSIIPPITPAPVQPTTQPPRRRRSSIRRPVDEMERFANIEERRVEAEMLTARSLAELSQQMGNIANALLAISNAILEMARR